MTPNEQPTRWEKTAETTNPAVIAEMTAEEPPNSLHIERLTPNTYCIITPDHTHYIHAPTTGRDATVRLIAHGHDPRDPDVEMTRDRDDHRSIDTMWTSPRGKMRIARRSKHRYDMILNRRRYRFEKIPASGPELQMLDRLPKTGLHRR